MNLARILTLESKRVAAFDAACAYMDTLDDCVDDWSPHEDATARRLIATFFDYENEMARSIKLMHNADFELFISLNHAFAVMYTPPTYE